VTPKASKVKGFGAVRERKSCTEEYNQDRSMAKGMQESRVRVRWPCGEEDKSGRAEDGHVVEGTP
jgi:hypothetical protein